MIAEVYVVLILNLVREGGSEASLASFVIDTKTVGAFGWNGMWTSRSSASLSAGCRRCGRLLR